MEQFQETASLPEDKIVNGNRRFTDAWYRDQLEVLRNLNIQSDDLDMEGILYLFEESSTDNQRKILRAIDWFLSSVVQYVFDELTPEREEELVSRIYDYLQVIQEILQDDKDMNQYLSENLEQFYQDSVKPCDNENYPKTCPISIDDMMKPDYEIIEVVRNHAI